MTASKPLLIALFGLGLLVRYGWAADAPGDPLDNWPRWRGPLANGTAPRGNPPLKWDDQTNIKWKAPLPGRGSSTPIVWGDQVIVLAVFDTGRAADAKDLPKPEEGLEKRTNPPNTYHQFLVLCLDRSTGKVRWQHTATEQVPHEGHHPTHSYAAYSPVTDGKFLYAWFGSRGIYCYDLAGKLQWKRDFGRLNTRLGWGEGGSPALHGDTLVVNFDQEKGSAYLALDARTGQTKWKVERDEQTTWATPLIVEHNGRAQVVAPGTNRVRSYDLTTGELAWQAGGLTVNPIPSPVRFEDTVICMSGYRGAVAYAVPLDARGDLTVDKLLWRLERGTPYVPSPLLYDDRLYFTQANNAILSCLDAKTGKVLVDRERLPSLSTLYASPTGAAGRIYITGREGTTVVLKKGDKLEVLATNELSDPIDASPVVVGKQLFLRGAKHLYCIEEK